MQHILTLPKAPYDFPQDKSQWNGIVLVGEAPGREEIRLGRPFVGRSGQLLNETLAKSGIERAHCVVANVFRFQPPANKVDHFFISKRAAVAEGVGIAEEYGKFGSAWCRKDFAPEIEHLRKTLAEWRPRVIVALGRTPFWALTGEGGLLSKVGQRMENRLLPGTPLIPTYHPSFILRGNWGLVPTWIEHFVASAKHVS